MVVIVIAYILTLKFILNWANILCSFQVIQQKGVTEVVKCQLIPTAVAWGDMAKLCIVISRQRCMVEGREWSRCKEGAILC